MRTVELAPMTGSVTTTSVPLSVIELAAGPAPAPPFFIRVLAVAYVPHANAVLLEP